MNVLALAANYEPLGVIPWSKAISLVYSEKAVVVEEYDFHVRSPSVVMKVPAVVVYKNNYTSKTKHGSVRFCRRNVWLRDQGVCQYCREMVTFSSFTLDHVIPKVAGGKTTWENVVSCCYSCNQKKGNKSLKESGFDLLNVPRKPYKLSYNYFSRDFHGNEKKIPQAWKFYLER